MFERYFTTVGILSAGLFYKDMDRPHHSGETANAKTQMVPSRGFYAQVLAGAASKLLLLEIRETSKIAAKEVPR